MLFLTQDSRDELEPREKSSQPAVTHLSTDESHNSGSLSHSNLTTSNTREDALVIPGQLKFPTSAVTSVSRDLVLSTTTSSASDKVKPDHCPSLKAILQAPVFAAQASHTASDPAHTWTSHPASTSRTFTHGQSDHDISRKLSLSCSSDSDYVITQPSNSATGQSSSKKTSFRNIGLPAANYTGTAPNMDLSISELMLPRCTGESLPHASQANFNQLDLLTTLEDLKSLDSQYFQQNEDSNSSEL